MTPARILFMAKAVVAAMWPMAVAAAPLTFGQAVERVTGLEWLLVVVLSTLAGVTALFIRISAHINDVPADKPAPPIPNVWLLVSAHMCGSWLAGLVGFFLAAHVGMSGLLVGFFVPMCAFGGAQFLELVYNKFVKSKIGALP